MTAGDVSGSIDPSTEVFEFDGMAAAIVHPAFLKAIARGYCHRIGFSAFTWSSQGGFTLVVPWTLIDLEEAAKVVAQQFRDALGKPRYGYSTPGASSAFPAWRRGLSTDDSAAINLAMDSLAQDPFPSARQVINTCANGADNVGEGSDMARANALISGAVVNGLIIGDHPDVATYFRERVQGGPWSFVIETRQFCDILDAMLAKFHLDLVMNMLGSICSSSPAWDQLPTRP